MSMRKGRAIQAPNIMKGHWDYVARGQGLLARLRRQTLPMLLVIAVTTLAAFNAILLPSYLERQIGASAFLTSKGD